MINALLYNRVTDDGSRWVNFNATMQTRRALEKRGLISGGKLTAEGLAMRERICTK